MTSAPARVPHPVIYTLLYIPFGALSGFVGVALTFVGSAHGLSVADASLLNGANMLTSWLKWTWAPMVDVTLSPKKWYVFATVVSALGVFGMSALPISQDTLPLLLLIIAVASLINSIVGMAIEAILAVTTTPAEQGRVSAWFQAGNLGGSAFGGALGLLLLETLPAPWMAGALMAAAFMACCVALRWVPDVQAHKPTGGVWGATVTVVRDVWAMLKTRPGFLSALLCVLPLGTGAAQGVLAQAEIARHWGAGATEVGLVQGLLGGVVLTVGCFAGGWLCDRFHPRNVYAATGLSLALIAIGMGLSPATVPMYVGWNMLYSLAIGLSYSGFTAVVLSAIGSGSAATKYSFFASLSNFPIWWVGLLLGRVADRALGATTTAEGGHAPVPASGLDVWLAKLIRLFHVAPGPTTLLYAEALFGVLAVVLFALVVNTLGRDRKPAPAA
jgi:MFS family permease